MWRFIFILLLSSLAPGTTVSSLADLDAEPSLRHLGLIPQGLSRLQEAQVKNDALRGVLRTLGLGAWDCAFSPSTKGCAVAFVGVLEVMKASRFEFAKFLVQEFGCLFKMQATTCNQLGQCRWSDMESRCAFSHLSFRNAASPCAQAAPLFFKAMGAVTVCSKIGEKKICSATKQCRWSDEDAGCTIDFFQVVFDVESYMSKTVEAASSIFQEKFSAIKQDPKMSPSNFTWDLVLHWDPPSGTCPTGTEKIICEIIEAYLSVYFPITTYCHGKYNSGEGCAKDPLCNTDSTGSCIPSSSSTKDAYEAMAKILVGTVPEGPDKQYISSLLRCPNEDNAFECEAGGCVWNPATNKCRLNFVALFQSITAAAGSDNDGLCAYLETISRLRTANVLF